MPSRTSMLHVRVDDDLKQKASAILADIGLTLSDAVRILLTRIEKENGLPASLTADPDGYDRWFRAKVLEAMESARPLVPHDEAVAAMRANLDAKTGDEKRG